MRKLITITTILLVSVIIMSGCKKSSSSSNSSSGSYYMKASIGTYSFDAEGASKAYSGGSSSGGTDYIYIYGKVNDGKTIKITLMTATGVPLTTGTLPIASGNAAAYYYPYGYDSTYTYALSGSVILTAISPNYVGTINFTCADSTQVTNGSFSIKVL